MPQKHTAKAVDKLNPSKLDTAKQMELLGGDVDVDDVHLQIRESFGIDITGAISDITVDRTIDGASTVTVIAIDSDERNILTSGALTKGVDMNIDGLWFTFTGVKKTGLQLSLIFEEREVNLLRKYNKPIFANRNKVTRAQFVLRMIREVKEEHIQWCIPELNIKEPVSDISQGTVLVNAAGQPTQTAKQVQDDTTAEAERAKGIQKNTSLTVKGVAATPEQIKNANAILATAEGMNAPRKVMVCSIMTAIAESRIINLTGGDRDSVGIFQQRRSEGWPATRDIPTDATAFIHACMSLNKEHPQYSDALLCQAVQHSAFSDGSNYAPWQKEGEDFVNAFDRDPTSSEASQLATTGQLNSNTNLFMRGQVSSAKGMQGTYVLTPENSWNCMQRLANEVNWRAFVVSGVVYFISDHWLWKSKPFMTISEDTEGIDWIDCDYDEGKTNGTLTVTAHLSRWSCPPGSTVQIEKMGPLNDKWLVEEVERSLYDTIATITLIKPLPLLPEPVDLSGIPKGFTAGITAPDSKGNSQSSGFGNTGPTNNTQNQIVSFAKSQLGVPYKWGAEEIGVAFDCSGLTQAAYASAGISIPHNALAQYNLGHHLSKAAILEPGDLVFFGSSPSTVEHVGIYIGDGKMIDAPHTGADVRVDQNFTNWTNPPFVGAARTWQK